MSEERIVDWIRPAYAELSEAIADKRREAVEAFLEASTPTELFECAKAALGRGDVPDRLIEAVTSADSAFSVKHGNEELKILAVACLRELLRRCDDSSSATEMKAATCAALSLAALGFPSRKQTAQNSEHVAAAREWLLQTGATIREASLPKVPAFPRVDFSQEALAQLKQGANNNASSLYPLLDRLWNDLGDLSNAATLHATASRGLSSALKVQREETNILWWILSEWSKGLQKPLSSLSIGAAALVVASELQSLSVFSVPHPSIDAFLARAMKASGTPWTPVKMLEAINDCPRSWREVLVDSFEDVGSNCPVSFAIAKSLDTDSPDSWEPVFAAKADISLTEPVPALAIAQQLFFEIGLDAALKA